MKDILFSAIIVSEENFVHWSWLIIYSFGIVLKVVPLTNVKKVSDCSFLSSIKTNIRQNLTIFFADNEPCIIRSCFYASFEADKRFPTTYAISKVFGRGLIKLEKEFNASIDRNGDVMTCNDDKCDTQCNMPKAYISRKCFDWWMILCFAFICLFLLNLLICAFGTWLLSRFKRHKMDFRSS